MILKVFSLLDVKAGIYNQPFFMAHAGQAIRAVTDLGQDKSTVPGRHPADFMLVEIGEFDDATGVMTSHHITKPLGLVASFLPVVEAATAVLKEFVQEGDKLDA